MNCSAGGASAPWRRRWRYNPLSYHNGSVWPHDNAIVAHGLAKYGLRDAARAVTEAVLDVAVLFGGRLPAVRRLLP